MSPMAEQDPRPRPAPDVTEAGVPAIDEVPEEMIRTGDIMEGEIPPLDRPQGAEEYGTTKAEQQRPETFAERKRREEPDGFVAADPQAVAVAGPDAPGGILDADTSLLGDDESEVLDTPSPEESALRVTDDLPGATDDASPGYLEEEGPTA